MKVVGYAVCETDASSWREQDAVEKARFAKGCGLLYGTIEEAAHAQTKHSLRTYDACSLTNILAMTSEGYRHLTDGEIDDLHHYWDKEGLDPAY